MSFRSLEYIRENYLLTIPSLKKKMANHKDYLVSRFSEKEDVDRLRRLSGLPPIEEKTYPCARCKKDFLGEYKRGVKLTWYCYKCSLAINRGISTDGCEDSSTSLENDFQP